MDAGASAAGGEAGTFPGATVISFKVLVASPVAARGAAGVDDLANAPGGEIMAAGPRGVVSAVVVGAPAAGVARGGATAEVFAAASGPTPGLSTRACKLAVRRAFCQTKDFTILRASRSQSCQSVFPAFVGPSTRKFHSNFARQVQCTHAKEHSGMGSRSPRLSSIRSNCQQQFVGKSQHDSMPSRG